MIVVMKTGKHKPVNSENPTNKTGGVFTIANTIHGANNVMYSYESWTGCYLISSSVSKPRYTDRKLQRKKFIGFNQ